MWTRHRHTVHYTCHWHTNTYRFQSLLHAHTYAICSHTLQSQRQPVFSSSHTRRTICTCTHIMHAFIACALPLCSLSCVYATACVCVSVCVQPPQWNTAPERDWNQYFLLRHLSHLYKAETIWTPVYSTLASFIKLPHLTKTRARAHTHTHTWYAHKNMQHTHTSMQTFWP